MRKDYVIDPREQNPWHCIAAVKGKSESFEESMLREVKKETGIHLKTTALLDRDREKHFFHTHLTDANVNNIVRQDGKVLGFFSPKELDTISLSDETKSLITSHKDLLEKVEV